LLLNTIPEMLIDDSVDSNLGCCEVIVDKMSRIIYTLENNGRVYKKFSFAFPFYLKENPDEGLSKWIICDNSGEFLNSQIISILIILFNEGLFNENISTDIEPLEFYERIYRAIKEVDAIIDIAFRKEIVSI